MSDYPDTPVTRTEQYLAAGLDGGDLPDPITREEKYLHEIATKMQGGGGSSVTVEPLTVTQNGTTTAPSGKAYNPVTVKVPTPTPSLQSKSVTVTQNGTQNITPDSGYDGLSSVAVTTNVPNPNYVETISGTLANPWGDYGFSTLASEIASQAVSCYITAESKKYMPYGYDSQSVRYWAGGRTTTSKAILQSLTYDSNGVLTDAKSFIINTITAGDQTVRVADTNPSTKSVLTIIHHTLPSNG